MSVKVILLIVALICFLVAAVPAPLGGNLVAAGLAFLTASFLVA